MNIKHTDTEATSLYVRDFFAVTPAALSDEAQEVAEDTIFSDFISGTHVQTVWSEDRTEVEVVTERH